MAWLLEAKAMTAFYCETSMTLQRWCANGGRDFQTDS